MTRRKATDFIVVHCAATKPSMDIGVTEITRWHTDPPPKGRGWKDIGYHFVIRRSGEIENGRAVYEIGAHVAGYNHNSVGVCLVGGIDAKGKAQNNFTPLQFATLRGILKNLKHTYPKAEIVGHRDLNSGKECPSFDVAAWLKDNPV